MRARVWITAMAAATVGALWIPAPAVANGGAYFDLNRTHYLPGSPATGSGTVYVPRAKQDVFEQGPFYAFVLPQGTSLHEGRPLPAGVIRVGTLSVRHSGGEQFDLRMSFTVPELPGDFYSVAICNDPCTISGFREPLTATISVVATAREGQLLTENVRLEGQISGLERDLKKSAEGQDGELQAAFDAGEEEQLRLSGEVNRLEDRLAAARAADAGSRAVIDPWAAAAIAIAFLALAVALVIRRRRPVPIEVPDTIEEIEPRVEDPAPR